MSENASAPSRPGILSLVLIPAILSLVVTVVRVVGELKGWDPFWFGPGMGDNLPDGTPVPIGKFGVSFLIPLFGIYFAWRIRRSYGSPSLLRAIVGFLVGLGVTVGLCILFWKMELVQLPDPKAVPLRDPTGLQYVLAALGAGLVIGLIAWPRLAATLLVYGLFVRIPVIVVTYLAVNQDWKVHYVKLPPGVPAKEGFDRVMFLSVPQISLWPVFTVLAGGLVGSLLAGLVRSKDAPGAD
ncbi:MAG: hypothetical protein KDC87_16120 [Planctomycetes bacterium]|nr:hypothetical protein [Planctomycetota bacterium]MCB9868542.1 hypothetical protein [Planctomycetota bacterium]